MGFSSTTFEPEIASGKNPSCAQKSASGKFFESNRNHVYKIKRKPLKPQQEDCSTPTKTASGVLFEHYRYTAFGEVTIYDGSGNVQSSTQINNTITWNTRRLDAVSNYYLYKYRHYDAKLGRWPSRDPIEESGGVNLYAFVGNDSLN